MIFGAALLAPLLTSVGSSLVGKLLGPSAPSSSSPDAFAALLDKARAGEINSDQPVTLTQGVKLDLSADQLARLGKAADQAQASGMTQALVFLDGQALKLDVGSRTITGMVDGAAAAVAGIDGVISAPPSRFADLLHSPGAQTPDAAAQTQPLLQQQLLLSRLNGARSTVLPRVRWSLAGSSN